MWLDRLPPDYRRRYYTNLCILVALVLFVLLCIRLGPHTGSLALLALAGMLLTAGWLLPAFRLFTSRPLPNRFAISFAAAYVLALGYGFGAIFQPALPGGAAVLLLGLLGYLTFIAVYRKIVFPSLFSGEFRERYAAVLAARRADRAQADELVASLRRPKP